MKTKHHLYTINTRDLKENITGILQLSSVLKMHEDQLATLISDLVKKHVDHAVSYALELGMTPEDNGIDELEADAESQLDESNRIYAEG